jgi:hypothetical protein
VAQVDRATRHDVDHLLKWSTVAWQELTEVEREIDGWDLIDQLVFLEEWPLEEERLRRLADLAQTGSLTGDQCARYEELLRLVARQRPIIERLLRS